MHKHLPLGLCILTKWQIERMFEKKKSKKINRRSGLFLSVSGKTFFKTQECGQIKTVSKLFYCFIKQAITILHHSCNDFNFLCSHCNSPLFYLDYIITQTERKVKCFLKKIIKSSGFDNFVLARLLIKSINLFYR